jgi:hypothetical protein
MAARSVDSGERRVPRLRAGSVSHRLSLAARAFKAQAMAAAELSGEPTADTEVFRRGEFSRPRLVLATLQNA